jgi:hypothetical protein
MCFDGTSKLDTKGVLALGLERVLPTAFFRSSVRRSALSSQQSKAKVDAKGGLATMALKLWNGRSDRVAFDKAIKEARSSIAGAHSMADPEALAFLTSSK